MAQRWQYRRLSSDCFARSSRTAGGTNYVIINTINQSRRREMKINPYLMFNGDCDAALKFYEQTLGAKIESKMTFAGSPAEKHVPAGWGDKVLHARLMVGDTVVMASDRRNSTKSL